MGGRYGMRVSCSMETLGFETRLLQRRLWSLSANLRFAVQRMNNGFGDWIVEFRFRVQFHN